MIATYNDAGMGDLQVSPEGGTIAFGSGLHQWAFTLKKFALKKFTLKEFRLKKFFLMRIFGPRVGGAHAAVPAHAKRRRDRMEAALQASRRGMMK